MKPNGWYRFTSQFPALDKTLIQILSLPLITIIFIIWFTIQHSFNGKQFEHTGEIVGITITQGYGTTSQALTIQLENGKNVTVINSGKAFRRGETLTIIELPRNNNGASSYVLQE